MQNLLKYETLTQTMDDLPVGVGIFQVQDAKDLKSIRYIFMNKLLLHEMRKEREEVFGKFIVEVAPEAYEHQVGLNVIETYRDVAVNGGSVNLGTVKYENEEVAGTYECSVHHIQDNYVYVLLNNVTELMQSRKELSELNKNLEKEIQHRTAELVIRNQELEQFVYIASHDLQEPLRTVNSFTDLLVKEYKGKLDANAETYIRFISEASSRMRELVIGVLEYSRLGQKKQLNTIDCNTLVSNVLKDLTTIITESRAEFTIEDLPRIQGYETELRMLFQNLITNAIKFCKKNTAPQITISVSKKNAFWEFSFQDKGIGIADGYKEKIFNIFQRLNARKEFEGTGIGLAHCRKIVELHGGRIWVKSELGVGSTFYFTLPY